MSTLQAPAPPALELAYSLPNGERITRKLTEGDSVVIGSDTSADLRLEAADVARMHCMVRMHDGKAIVRDCYSSAGTFVNEERIRETVLHYDSQVRIGSRVINVRVGRQPAPYYPSPPDFGSSNEPTHGTAEARSAVESPGVAEAASSREALSAAGPGAGSEMQAELERAYAEIAALRERQRILEKTVAESEADSVQQETIELLRSEIFELQAALAESDESGAPLPAFAAADTEGHDALEPEEADKLVARLEQLLEELRERDEQVALLNDLLHAAEDANRADQEERGQLDSWVADIERRFSQREQEWAAERDALIKNKAARKEEQLVVQTALAADDSAVRAESLQRLTASLREQIGELQASLAAAQQRNQELEQQLNEARGAYSREEAVKLCQERAEIARLRRDLELKRQEVERRPAVDTRSLREHLLQRDEEEEPPKKAGLSSRVARLWNLIDGR